MTGKSKFILMLFGVFCGFVVIQIMLFVTHKNVDRSSASLMNQYYRLKESNPLAARRTLEVLIQKDPHNQTALRELAFWYLGQGDIKSSMAQFELAYKNDPKDIKSALQLAKLYIAFNQTDKAYTVLSSISDTQSPLFGEAKSLLSQLNVPKTTTEKIPSILQALHKTQSLSEWMKGGVYSTVRLQTLYHMIASTSETGVVKEKNASQQKPAAPIAKISDRDKMMNEFYDLKKKNSPLAWEKINEIVLKYPNDVDALKEAGYYALITLKSNPLAEPYFVRVYHLTSDPKIALQLGYIYDALKQKRIAYYYFDLATHTDDMKDRMTAELAKTNFRGVQTLFLPSPFFASVDFTPLYMSRFKLMIYPIIFRTGITLNEKFNWKVYLSYRRTSDNKSITSNQISNIFEDNAAITAVGTTLTPLPTLIPQLIAFTEIGKAIDLVYRNRARYRNDFRGGLAYYNEWGRPATYTLKPTFKAEFNADIYADAIYYNRYHDGIATMRVRPGVKVFQYGSMSVDLYYRIFLIEDQARQFYNNLIELGPGIAIKLSERYNVVMRYQQIHGRYLPANSPSRNPYSTNYHNTVTELDTYFEF